MLIAINQESKQISVRRHTRMELKILKQKETYFCPECQEKVILKIGKSITPHFSHHQHSTCRQKYGESEFHQKGKLQLYEWLASQYEQVYLEKFLPSLSQIPDIFIQIKNKAFAVEFQCAQIPVEVIDQRTKGYLSKGIWPIWVIGSNQFKQKAKQRVIINQFLKQLIHYFPKGNHDIMFYYCPHSMSFLTLSNLIMTSQTQCLATIKYIPLHTINLPQLLQTFPITSDSTFHLFSKIKQNNRLRKHSNKWCQYLYRQGMHPSLVSSLIFLPVSQAYFSKVPPWEWQSHFIMDYFKPLPIDAQFKLNDVLYRFRSMFHNTSSFPLMDDFKHPLHTYLEILNKLGYLTQSNAQEYKKVKNVSHHRTLETALDEDKRVIYHLSRLINGIEK